MHQRTALLAALLCGCGTPISDVADASTGDATADVPHNDATIALPNCMLADGGTLSDWPGWSRTPALEGCCMTDVPDDVDASVPPLLWKPCDADAGCSKLDMTWDAGGRPPTFFEASVSRGDDGNAHYLVLGRWLYEDNNDQIYEFDGYDLHNSAAVGAWRVHTTESQLAGECTAAPMPTPNGMLVTADDYRAGEPFSIWSAWGPMPDVLRAPTFARFSGPELEGWQDLGASDSILAFDVSGAIGVRVPVGGSTYVRSFGQPALLFAFAEGDAAFFESEYGNAGWGQIWRLDADGTKVLIRQATSRHVFSPATDGQTLFWVEAYGSNNDLAMAMDAVEVWAAPYSTDPNVINSGAHRLATFPNARVPAFPIAFHGTYMLNTLITTPQWHAVRTDGTVADIESPDPTRYLGRIFYVDDQQLLSLSGALPSLPPDTILRVPLPAFH